MVRRFASCELDLSSRELRRNNKPVHVSPKAFELLKLLVERAPSAVSKEEIHTAVWSGTFVSDGSLTNVVAEIRSAVGDSARAPSILRTVHGFGYAFVGDLDENRAPKQPKSRPAGSCSAAGDSCSQRAQI